MKKKLVMAGLAICMAMAAPAFTNAPAAKTCHQASKCDKASTQKCAHCAHHCTQATCPGCGSCK